MRTTRQGAVNRYFDFLIDLHRALGMIQWVDINDMAAKHHISKYSAKVVKEMNIIKTIKTESGKKVYQWNYSLPSEKLAKRLLTQTNEKTNRHSVKSEQIQVPAIWNLSLDMVTKWLDDNGYFYIIKKTTIQEYTNANPVQL